MVYPNIVYNAYCGEKTNSKDDVYIQCFRQRVVHKKGQ
jgi:hypothetical protein